MIYVKKGDEDEDEKEYEYEIIRSEKDSKKKHLKFLNLKKNLK